MKRMRFSHSGRVATIVLVGLSVGATLTAVAISVPAAGRLTPPAATPAADETRALFAKLGIGAQELAAAGVTASEVTQVVSACRSYLAENPTALSAAESAFRTAQQHYEELLSRARSGRGDSTSRDAVARALAEVTEAKGNLLAELQRARAASLSGLTAEQTAALNAITSENRWDVPVQYRTLQQTEQDWVRLRNALAVHRTTEARDENCPPEARACIQTANGSPAVALAASRLQENLPGVQAAWDGAFD